MKIYVDGELPKNCKECHFMIDRGELKSSRLCYEKNFVNCDCKLNPNIGYIGITKPHGCPLATTQSLKQQVRKEVCEKIKKHIFNHFNVKNMEEYENLSLIDSLFTADVVIEMLDTILKEYQK